MKKIFLLPIFLLFLLLTACNTYVQPAMNQPYATIKGYSFRNGLFEWRNAGIQSIDEKDIARLRALGPDTGTIRLMPGPHLLVINVVFNRSFGGSGPYETLVDLPVLLQDGQAYFLNTQIKGSKVQVWLENPGYKRVSEVGESTYQAYIVR